MKLIPALFFIAVGIWATFTYPEQMKQVYAYLLMGIDYVIQTYNELMNG